MTFGGLGVSVPASPDDLLYPVDVASRLVSVLPPAKEWEAATASAETEVAAALDAGEAAKPGSVDDATVVRDLAGGTRVGLRYRQR